MSQTSEALLRRWNEATGEVDLHIELTMHRDATIAICNTTIGDQQYLWTACSKRDAQDPYNPEVGIKLAVARVLENAARQLAKQANGIVKSIDDGRAERESKLDHADGLMRLYFNGGVEAIRQAIEEGRITEDGPAQLV